MRTRFVYFITAVVVGFAGLASRRLGLALLTKIGTGDFNGDGRTDVAIAGED